MAGLVLAALAGGMQGAGAAGEKALARMQETEEKLNFERERSALEAQRQQALNEQLQTHALERQRISESGATNRTQMDIDARRIDSDKRLGAEGQWRKDDREARAAEAKADREARAAEAKADRDARERLTRMQIEASAAAARLQAERANTQYMTGNDGNLYKVQNGQFSPVTNADGQSFKAAKDVSQSALKIADIYQSQAKAAYDAAKNDPAGAAELRKEGDRLSALAAGIISGKMPEPKFSQPSEQANKYLLEQIRAGKGTEAVRAYEEKFGPGSATRVPGVLDATKPAEPVKPAPAPPSASTTTPARREPIIDSALGRFIQQEQNRPDGPRFKFPAPLLNLEPK